MQSNTVTFWMREWWKALKSWRCWKERGCFSRPMTPKKASKWFKDNSIDVMVWPAQSPDINPIEHLWVDLKKALNKYPNPANGVHELWERVVEEWNKIPPETCQNLIESMPRRIQAVIKAKGGHTKY